MQRLRLVRLSQYWNRTLAVFFTWAALVFVTLGCANTSVAAGDATASVEARNVQTVHFFSESLNQERAFSLILPLDYESSTSRYPVLYLLHGYGGNNTDWTLLTNLSAYAARYRLIIILPDGSNGWYVNSASDPKQKFEDQIMKDLIPYVESHYRTIPLRRARAIAGASMGGYGAMFLGLKYYERFTAVASFSGAVAIAHESLLTPGTQRTEKERKADDEVMSHFGPVGSAAARERDPFELVKKIPIQDMPMLYIAEGGEDFLIKGNHEFVDLLASLKIPYEYREVSPRVHSWDFGDEQIQVFLQRLARLPGFESHEMGRAMFLPPMMRPR